MIIVADLHLTPAIPEKTSLFRDFVNSLKLKDKLFILGDLFDFWVGDDLGIDFYSQEINILRKAKCEIYIQKGNRDFLLNKTFFKITKTKLLNDYYSVIYANKSFLLCHGDQFLTKDYDYQRLRKQLKAIVSKKNQKHNKIWIELKKMKNKNDNFWKNINSWCKYLLKD